MADAHQFLPDHCYDTLSPLLSQIRLLEVLPATAIIADIQCRLTTVSLDMNKNEYEALSYTWGSQSNKHSIFIDGMTMEITSNLDVALRYLRQKDKQRTLWVDAICINQADVDEKNQQVRHMRDIYANASAVLVWLGELDDDMEQAIQFFREPEVERDRRYSQAFKTLDSRYIDPNRRDAPLASLARFFNKPWWFRMWVVQEVTVAKTDPLLICGEQCVPWDVAIMTLELMSHDQVNAQEDRRSLTDPLALQSFTLLKSSSNRTLAFLLEATCNRKASDVRDRIYALLGLVSDPSQQTLEPDYNMAENVLFQKAMVSVFRSRRDLDWLLYARAENTTYKPTWCIDFLQTTWLRAAYVQHWHVVPPEEKAHYGVGATAGRDMIDFAYEPQSGSLKIVGTEVGLIESVHKTTCTAIPLLHRIRESLTPSMEDSVKKIHHDIDTFTIDAHRALERRLGPDEASRKVTVGDIWKVAAADTLVERFNYLKLQYKPYTGWAILEMLAQRRLPIRPLSKSLPSLELNEREDSARRRTVQAQTYLEVANHAAGRYLFTTHTGFIGRASHQILKQDVLCILFGCQLPAVLRLQENNTYELITFTYTDGIMSGEIFEGENEAQKRTFVLQ